MISRAEKRELRRINRRGTAPQAGEGLIRQGLVQPAHTTQDGQGGYTVDCYAVSEKGKECLKHKHSFAKAPSSIYKTIIAVVALLPAVVAIGIFLTVVYRCATGQVESGSIEDLLLLAVKSMTTLTLPPINPQ